MANHDRILIVLRHAKSAWPEEMPDHRRPLNERGQADAPAAGRWLSGHRYALDLVLCSTANRARQTWELASRELTDAPPARFDDDLYDASAGDLLAVVNGLPDLAESTLLIGHNPGMSELVTLLTGTRHELRTASLAVLGISGGWSDVTPGSAELLATAKPRG